MSPVGFEGAWERRKQSNLITHLAVLNGSSPWECLSKELEEVGRRRTMAADCRKEGSSRKEKWKGKRSRDSRETHEGREVQNELPRERKESIAITQGLASGVASRRKGENLEGKKI